MADQSKQREHVADQSPALDDELLAKLRDRIPQALKLYIKLPSWFTVTTLIGEFNNPDCAIVMENPKAVTTSSTFSAKPRARSTSTSCIPTKSAGFSAVGSIYRDTLEMGNAVIASSRKPPIYWAGRVTGYAAI